jgi:NAD(P)-dependent dehydrogenase (short-subunit alcohol dehydrogenase family)
MCNSGRASTSVFHEIDLMRKRIFITGSTDGLGLAAARDLITDGHDVVLHARNRERAETLSDSMGSAPVLLGELGNAEEVKSLARAVNQLGRFDAVIHNAAIYSGPRAETPEGNALTLAVNALAPYMLTALIEQPRRLIYISSGMHHTEPHLEDINWTKRRWSAERAYSESKLYLTAFAFAVARTRPEILTNVVDPGWVPTKMGGAGAPDDLAAGHATQAWLAVSDENEACVTGKYWYHRRQQQPASITEDVSFQESVISKCAELTGLHHM